MEQGVTMDVFSYLLEKSNTKPNLQVKEVTISQNGESEVVADEGYDGLSKVEITTNITYTDYWSLNTSYTNATNEGAWAFADTDVTIPQGNYLLTCDVVHTVVAGDANKNTNVLIYKYADNVDHLIYFGNASNITFTEEVKKIALFLAPDMILSNIKLLKMN